jgi:hypothetical protein
MLTLFVAGRAGRAKWQQSVPPTVSWRKNHAQGKQLRGAVLSNHFSRLDVLWFVIWTNNRPLNTVKTLLSNLMFSWPCITVYQHSETNVMHFSFNVLRIKGLYMFRALLAHPQEVLHKRHLVYCVRVMSVGITRIGVDARNIPSAVCVAPPGMSR